MYLEHIMSTIKSKAKECTTPIAFGITNPTCHILNNAIDHIKYIRVDQGAFQDVQNTFIMKERPQGRYSHRNK